MGRREDNDPKQATAPKECGQWRGTSEFRVGVPGLPAALAAYLNQEQSLTPWPGRRKGLRTDRGTVSGHARGGGGVFRRTRSNRHLYRRAIRAMARPRASRRPFARPPLRALHNHGSPPRRQPLRPFHARCRGDHGKAGDERAGLRGPTQRTVRAKKPAHEGIRASLDRQEWRRRWRVNHPPRLRLFQEANP